jgi:hypothetical protein
VRYRRGDFRTVLPGSRGQLRKEDRSKRSPCLSVLAQPRPNPDIARRVRLRCNEGAGVGHPEPRCAMGTASWVLHVAAGGRLSARGKSGVLPMAPTKLKDVRVTVDVFAATVPFAGSSSRAFASSTLNGMPKVMTSLLLNQGRASRMRVKGVSVALRKRLNPA